MSKILALNLKCSPVIDPAVEAYYAVQNATDAADTIDRESGHGAADRAERAVYRAYHALAAAVPTTRDGIRRKIEMGREFASSLAPGSCEHGALLDEEFENLLQRNLETLDQGFEAFRA